MSAVEKLLTNNNISFTASGRDYLIKCLNPQHDDSNPSCRVDKQSGITHCFSCGWKANLFRHFGVLERNIPSLAILKVKEKLKDLREANYEIPFPEGFTPYTKPFRGLSSSTLKQFEAFYTTRDEDLLDRVIFPIKDITGRVVAFIGRHILSDAKPKYFIFPSGRSLPCYPQKVPKGESIVLVEGIIDMLNLYDKGLTNAVCTFGVSTLSENNVADKLLAYKAQGIQRVYILYDGDDAGREGAKKIKPLVESQGFHTEILELPDDEDPGSLSAEYIEQIKEYING